VQIIAFVLFLMYLFCWK